MKPSNRAPCAVKAIFSPGTKPDIKIKLVKHHDFCRHYTCLRRKPKKEIGKDQSFCVESFMPVSSCYLPTLVLELDSSTYITELALTNRGFL